MVDISGLGSFLYWQTAKSYGSLYNKQSWGRGNLVHVCTLLPGVLHLNQVWFQSFDYWGSSEKLVPTAQGRASAEGRRSDRKSPSLHAWKAVQAINFDSYKLGMAAGLVLEIKICVLAETLHHIAQLLHWGESLLGLWHCAFPRVSPATVDLLRHLNLHARPSSCLPDFISTKTRS